MFASLRAKRNNPEATKEDWIASSQELVAMTATRTTVILRSRALARRLEGSPRARLGAHPSRLAARGGERLRMTGEFFLLRNIINRENTHVADAVLSSAVLVLLEGADRAV